MSVAFDTLVYSNKLKEAGLDSMAAEAISLATADVLQNLMMNQLATKYDLKDVEISLKQDLRKDIKDLEIKMYVFMAKTALFTVGILGSLQTLFHFVK